MITNIVHFFMIVRFVYVYNGNKKGVVFVQPNCLNGTPVRVVIYFDCSSCELFKRCVCAREV